MLGKQATMRKVLVTRPQEDQQQTREALADLDIEAVCSPVMAVVRLPFCLPETDLQAVVVTSRNALRMLDADQLARLHRMPLYCVGGQTEGLARQLGFGTIGAVAVDVAQLLADLPQLLSPAGGPLLYLSGKHRSGSLANTLEAHHFDVTLLEVYEMAARGSLTAAALSAIGDKSLDGVLLYSQRTSQLLLSLIEHYRLEDAMRALTFFCLSPTVAAPLKGRGYSLVVAKAPNEGSLLECVKNRP